MIWLLFLFLYPKFINGLVHFLFNIFQFIGQLILGEKMKELTSKNKDNLKKKNQVDWQVGNEKKNGNNHIILLMITLNVKIFRQKKILNI